MGAHPRWQIVLRKFFCVVLMNCVYYFVEIGLVCSMAEENFSTIEAQFSDKEGGS
jgi:hypothetical protein